LLPFSLWVPEKSSGYLLDLVGTKIENYDQRKNNDAEYYGEYVALLL